MRIAQRFQDWSRRIFVLAGFLAASSSRAADGSYWQLTFAYNNRGLSLLRAAQMPQSNKAVRTPGLDGALLKLEYELEWRDALDQVVLAVPVIIPLGGRVVLGQGPSAAHEEHIMPEGAFVVRAPGPKDAGAASRIRLVKRDAGAGFDALAAAPATVSAPPAFAAAEHTFDLRRFAAALAAAGPVSVTKVRDTGADANRFVIAILGDGFTEANLAAGAFANKVTSFLTTFFGVSPWNNYSQVVNVYRIDVVSNESGADYEDNSPASGGTLKDTYFNSAFWVGNTERCLYLTGSGEARAFAAADAMVGVGVWDVLLMFVNSSKYGGCGGAVGVTSLNTSSDEIQIHELGHTFCGLADEYDYGSSATICTLTTSRNVDCSSNFPHVKWDVWVTPGTPVPTPDTPEYATAIGAFEGAAYQKFGMFRPKQNCRMRTLGVSFCPICKEAHILQLFKRIQIVDAADPPFGPAEVSPSAGRTFIVTTANLSGLRYQWVLDGAPILGATNSCVAITSSQIVSTNTELRLEVSHSTTNVRAEAITQTNSWRLRIAEQPTLYISDGSVVERNMGTTTLRLGVWASFPHPEPISVQYATTNGTATAGLDYMAAAGTLNFPVQQTTNSILITVHGDWLSEPNEVFFVNLFNPTNAILGDLQGTGVILDDDSGPVLTITRLSDRAVLSWAAQNAVLQETDSVMGDWSDVSPPPASPLEVPLPQPAKFYRLRLP
jgi:hypothetical protein